MSEAKIVSRVLVFVSYVVLGLPRDSSINRVQASSSFNCNLLLLHRNPADMVVMHGGRRNIL